MKSKAKKRRLLIIIMAAAVAALACLYFFVVVPLTAPEDEVDESQDVLEGEYSENGRILLFPHLERSSISAVEIHNSYGKYTVYKNGEGTFVLNGFEDLSLDATALSGVVVGAGYSLSMQRIVDHCDNLSEFGLAEEQSPAWYKVTDVEGNVYSVYIGSKLLSGAAYYAKASDRDSIYAISTSLIDPLLLGKENLVSKQITSVVSSTNAAQSVDMLAVYNGEEPLVAIALLSEEEKEEYGVSSSYYMLAPTSYNVNSDTFSEALENFSSFEVDTVLALGISNAKLKKYDLEDPAYTLDFNYIGENGDEENLLYISKRNENGNFYVASPSCDLIAEMSGDKLGFIEYDLIRWVDKPVFMVNINEVATIDIASDRVNETFTLTGEDQELQITSTKGQIEDVKNFRQFYKTLLSTDIQGYSELTDEQIAALADKKPQLTFTYVTRADKKTTYTFYEISERKSVVLINGEGGEFYLLYTQINKIASDTIKVVNGETVNSEDRS